MIECHHDHIAVRQNDVNEELQMQSNIPVEIRNKISISSFHVADKSLLKRSMVNIVKLFPLNIEKE